MANATAFVLSMGKLACRYAYVSKGSGNQVATFSGINYLLHFRYRSIAYTTVLKDSAQIDKKLPPELPVTCCMSGCANCVWLKYCEELVEYYKGDKSHAKQALEKIDDPSIKALIKLELGI
ncbi:Oxidoreductase-like domain-containing protein 1 [Trichoplax sp. H2]|nr:Oxidoreductase-like domain-containing protein 1 [Trichoplax sp. H2]|eukprot:RDD38206.1 Oxidoreductase-like domain-containing protein 1 [Trichoplax sp. H2]